MGEPSATPPDHGPRPLVRSLDDGVLGGVCAGVANQYGVPVLLVRLLALLLGLVSAGAAVGVYLALWLLLPSPSTVGEPLSTIARAGLDEMHQLLTSGGTGGGSDRSTT